MNKYKILMISDHLLSGSGVGTQGRYLATGLVNTGKYTIRQFGAAIRHSDYSIQQPHPEILIRPIDGFGTKELYRQFLATERPDAVMLFTDPRFFSNLFEVHDEFHQLCPIVYNHLWDQSQFPPLYNKNVYDACDLLNCINRPTYDFLDKLYAGQNKVNYIPHGVPDNIFKKLPDDIVNSYRKKITNYFKRRDYGEINTDNEFIILWSNRNAHRKRPADVLWSLRLFIDKLKEQGRKPEVTLFMHTNPDDHEGPKLTHIVELFNLQQHVIFSKNEISFEEMVLLYNSADITLNISFAEGFGLALLESMMCETPIVALKTGGMTRQVVNCYDETENGVALPVEYQKMVGSQDVPYIVEDYVSNETIADSILKMYDMPKSDRELLGAKCREYANKQFNLKNVIADWDRTIEECIKNWRSRRPKWTSTTI